MRKDTLGCVRIDLSDNELTGRRKKEICCSFGGLKSRPHQRLSTQQVETNKSKQPATCCRCVGQMYTCLLVKTEHFQLLPCGWCFDRFPLWTAAMGGLVDGHWKRTVSEGTNVIPCPHLIASHLISPHLTSLRSPAESTV